MRFLLPLLLILTLAGCGSSSPSTASTTAGSAAVTGSSLNHVHSIVVMPADPNEVYFGTHYHLYRSSNGGRSWTPLAAEMMLSMAQDEQHPQTIYALSLQRGLLKSVNGGKTWRSISGGMPKAAVSGVAVSDTTGAVLAYGNGIYRSLDGGIHWIRTLSGHSISSVACGGNSVYAASGDALFVSRDGGIRWKGIRTVAQQPIFPVIQVGAAARTAYAVTAIGVVRSVSGGSSWAVLSHAPIGIEFLGVAPSNPAEVIAEVGGHGFYVTHNAGLSWQRANSGIHDSDFNASTVRIAPSNPEVAYTGAWGLHIYATHDAGRRWTEVATLRH